MAMPDMTTLQATIDELRDELSRSRVQAEVFRALYTRQAAEMEHLQTHRDVPDPGPSPSTHRVRVGAPE